MVPPALLLLATLLAYQPAWHGGVLWDDDGHITRVDLRSTEGLARIWFSPGATQQYYPVVHSAFWLQHRLWGDRTLGYHLVSIALHALSAILIGLILRRLGIPGAFLAAVIFALHPVHVESVAWITEQKNVMSGVFYLGAALVYLEFDRTRRWRPYALAIGLFVLAVLSKSVTASLPAALLVVFWWQRGRLDWRRDVMPLLLFFLVGMAAGLMTVWFERSLIGAEGEDFHLTMIERCLVAGRAVWFYLWKLLWPANLIFNYPRWHIRGSDWAQYLYPVGILILLGALWMWRRRSRAPLAAMLFFCGTLFPALGFFNVYPFRYSFVADHFQYLASIGIIALVSAAFVAWSEETGKPKYAAAATALFVVVLGTLTWRQAHHYADAESLYRATLDRNPASWMARNNLAVVLLSGPWSEARGREGAAQAEEAIRLKPDYPQARYNLGTALERLGRLDEAVRAYREVLRVEPDSAKTHHRLGVALRALGRDQEAAAALTQALAHAPGLSSAHLDLGRLLAESGRTAEAIAHFQEVLRALPESAAAHHNLGSALLHQGQLKEALAELTEAARLDPTLVDTHLNLGGVMEQLGRLEDAVAHYQATVRLEPRLGVAHRNLGRALQTLGRFEEAAGAYRQALAVEPGVADVHNDLGVVLAELGRVQEAIAQFKEAVRLQPDDSGARANLARALRQRR